MKILIQTTVIALLAFACFSLQAQGEINVGAGLSYGSQVEELGVFFRGEYGINETWRGATSFNYFFWEDLPTVDFNWSTLNFDGHYILVDDETFQFYGLAGLNIAFLNLGFISPSPGVTQVNKSTEFGFNGGLGGRLNISENFAALLEVKVVLGDAEQFVPLLGVIYTIN